MTPLLRLSSVAKSYRRGHATIGVLRDVSLTVEAGSLVSVYGARASGKTTLLRVAAGFEAPDAGEVVGAGDVAWVQGNGPRTGGMPVETHVALPLYREHGPRAAHERARRALAALGVEQYAGACWEELPNVARTLCAIAHATVRGPRLLVADDPTLGLALLDRERVCAVLRSAAREDGLGVLMAVPDLSSMLRSDDTRVLSGGRLLAAEQRGSGDGGADVIRLPVRRSA